MLPGNHENFKKSFTEGNFVARVALYGTVPKSMIAFALQSWMANRSLIFTGLIQFMP